MLCLNEIRYVGTVISYIHAFWNFTESKTFNRKLAECRLIQKVEEAQLPPFFGWTLCLLFFTVKKREWESEWVSEFVCVHTCTDTTSGEIRQITYIQYKFFSNLNCDSQRADRFLILCWLAEETPISWNETKDFLCKFVQNGNICISFHMNVFVLLLQYNKLIKRVHFHFYRCFRST